MNRKTLQYGQHSLTEADINAVVEILRSEVITQGRTVERFGAALAKYAGSRYGTAVSSGSAALHIGVAAAGIAPGDELITTPITFCATANVALYQGATVRFVDIDPDTLTLDPNALEDAIGEHTKVIAPVDFRGHPADLPRIQRIAKTVGAVVLEDGSHSIGSTYTYNGSEYRAGDCAHADMCTFSFHPVKHITTGEGGAVTTNDPELQRKIDVLRKHGIDRRAEMFSEPERIGPWFYEMEELGFNYRLTDFQAALGLSQLKRLDAIKVRRREIVEFYNERFAEFPELILPFEAPNVRSNFHLYVLQVSDNAPFDRYELFEHLRAIDYRPMVHYIPVHLLKYYRNRFGYQPGDFPVAERYYARAISLPLYDTLTDADVERVTTDIRAFIRKQP